MTLIPGTYNAVPKAYEYGVASTRTEQIGILFAIVDENGHEVGEEITYYGYFTDAAAEHTMRVLRECGWTGEDLTDLAKDGFGSKVVEITIKNETYQGETRLKVKWVGPGGGVGLKTKMGDDAKKSFAERMRGHVLASRPQGATTPAAGAKQPRF